MSCEPLLGPLKIEPYFLSSYDKAAHDNQMTGREDRTNKLDWVICGGESGPGARPMHPDWARGLRDQCDEVGVPFMFKQWGEWAEESFAFAHKPNAMACGVNPTMVRVGKKLAGRLLDGREHLEFPEAPKGGRE